MIIVEVGQNMDRWMDRKQRTPRQTDDGKNGEYELLYHTDAMATAIKVWMTTENAIILYL